ncbi:MAG: ribulose-phosphate 3-epimerase [Firmicutes bacterium]|jgi:ribulose-phosphate 3-epimerase|nr:ribulose-phosphate 3-epimerase [Bacillota bacterium]
MVRVAPSILSADFSCLLEEVKRMERSGADWLHLDIMDGHFVPNITMGPLVVGALKGRVDLFFDVHLMVMNPQLFLTDFYRAGAGMLTVHAEACTHLHRVVQEIKKLGCKAGVALNPATPLNCLDYILEELDLVLIMSVNPGFGGQEFIPGVLPKINALAEEKAKRGLSLEIEVDGGINENTAVQVLNAGADILVAGSALFGAPDPSKLINAFKMFPVRRKRV